MKRIAVLTSGGDAAGMNAAIRAAVRTGLDRGWEVFGVRHGFAGLAAGDFAPLGARDVGGIIQHGGTALGSARFPEFKTEEARKKALDQLQRRNVSALVVIGGDGSQKGFPVVGVASTIDNDLYGSEITIGVDTALNIALEAIDRLKVTASSHQRAFLVETMGRDCGPRGRNGPRTHRRRAALRLRSRQGARDCRGGRRRGVQRRKAGAIFQGSPRAIGLRPASDDPRPYSAWRRAGRLRSPARNEVRRGGD